MFSRTIGETDEGQVLRLANRMARSAAVAAVSECAIAQRISAAKLAEFGYSDPWSAACFVEFLGKMAEYAYGSPYLRISDMDRRIIMEGPESREFFLAKNGMPLMMDRLLSPPYSTPGREFAALVNAGEGKWCEAGVGTIEELCREAGFSFHSIPGILDAFDEINSTDYLTMENLPAVASVWNEVYREPVPRIRIVEAQ
jgi:hypothetical protein